MEARSVSVKIDPPVHQNLVLEMLVGGRALGLPPSGLDALARDPSLCQAFVAAARRGDADTMEMLAVTAAARPQLPVWA